MMKPSPLSSGPAPGVAQAYAYLQGLARDPSWQARGELPGVRVMARLSGFSHFTMWKALRRAAEEGLLIVESGRRPRLKSAGEARAPGAQDTALRKWERLRVEIERDLLRGEYPPDEPPPSLKEMQGKYHVCYSTLRKALRALGQSGRWPPTPGHSAGRTGAHPVIYLAWGDEKGNQHFENPFDHKYLEALNSACSRLNLEPVTVVYAYAGTKLQLYPAPGSGLSFETLCERALGFLVRTACPRDVCRDLLPRLLPYRKPIAVLDELGSPSLPDLVRQHKGIKAFRHTISEASGEIMARHLLAMGHRRVALISPFQGAVWSRNRLAGISSTFAHSGPETAAVEFSREIPYQLPHDVRETQAFRILKQSMLQAGNRWNRSFPSLKGVLAGLEQGMHLAIRGERLFEALVPQMEAALARKDLTAWVAVDDDTAIMVLEFLRRRGLRTPHDLSVVGFDDTAEGARRDLTSFNFDFERFNHYVLRYLLEPARIATSERGGMRNPEGRVVARGSVRRADQAAKPPGMWA